jgi:hypothetical protein
MSLQFTYGEKMKTFQYNIDDDFGHSVVSIKGERKYYVSGYCSTIDRDKSGEVIAYTAQEDLHNQLKGENITLDTEHSEWYDTNGKVLAKPKNTTIPVAKVVESRLDEKGVWIKAELNQHISKFNEVWGSIKDGFLKAFSIAFYPIEKMGDGIIKRLNLVNITLTGSPVNPNATFTASMKSASAFLSLSMSENPPAEALYNDAGGNMNIELKGEGPNGEQGHWVTSRGRHIFISKDGKAFGANGKEFSSDEYTAQDQINSERKIPKENSKETHEYTAQDQINSERKIPKENSKETHEYTAQDQINEERRKKQHNTASTYKSSHSIDAADLGDVFSPKKSTPQKEADEHKRLKASIAPKSPTIQNAADKPFDDADLKNTEENTMGEEKKHPEPDSDNSGGKSDSDADNKKKSDEDEEEEKKKKSAKEKEAGEAKMKAEQIEILEAEVKALKEETARLKAELEKPVMKAVVTEMPKMEFKVKSPLQLIN